MGSFIIYNIIDRRIHFLRPMGRSTRPVRARIFDRGPPGRLLDDIFSQVKKYLVVSKRLPNAQAMKEAAKFFL
jgi:hypothetical protein